MKKKYVISLIVLALGIVLMFVGFLHDGVHPLYFSNKHNLVIGSKNKHVYRKINNQEVSGIKAISIENNSNVSIQPSSDPRIIVYNSKENNSGLSISNHELRVTGNENSGFMLVGLFQNVSNKTEIYLPENVYLNYIHQYNQSGDVFIKDINTKEMSLSGGSVHLQNVNAQVTIKIGSTDGDVHLSNVKANNTILNADDGDISIVNSIFNKGESQIVDSDGDVTFKNATFDSLYCNVSDGDINFYNLLANKKINAQSEDGDISGKIINDKNVKINAKSDDGSTDVYQPNNYTDPKHLKTYSFYTSDGDVNISKR
ncbi:DUF4097 domain-containing protein [Apilactobacillus sp. TMW 2.2459]|uniref:DUF4097 family beta strand repeat-containing protein n=1 Tax=Apilactobacillus xinyiensis TaxID=2841032 RepID=UPI00200EBDAC|nr:DUF4097 family beta strand repeat-containing protein [Apilactobacillus xinyiensis]MCL0312087.1 DUF4097 domain-containing protein [Apilactobacillus xinyiensis]